MTNQIGEILTKIDSLEPQVPPYFEQLETYSVKKVSDADTVEVTDATGTESIVRFVYIDAPETPKGWGFKKIEDKNSDNPLYQTQFKWGKQGKERLKELVETSNNQVKLRINALDTRYNRKIAEVYLLDGSFVQYILVREGLVQIYYDYFYKCPRDIAILLLLTEADAERQQRGLWCEQKSEFISPWLFRCLKTKQKSLIEDSIAYETLGEKLKLLVEKLKAGEMAQDEFEDKFKETLN